MDRPRFSFGPAGETSVSTSALRLNNGDSRVAAGVQGRYSPRNPRSDLFGKIGRNTPIRVREDAAGATYLVMPGFNDSYVSTPDIADPADHNNLQMPTAIQPTPGRPPAGCGPPRKRPD